MRTWNEIRCREMVELKKGRGRSDTHTSVLCQRHCKLRSFQRDRWDIFTGWMIDTARWGKRQTKLKLTSTTSSMKKMRLISSSCTRSPHCFLKMKNLTFQMPLTICQTLLVALKRLFFNATIYVTSATDFPVIEYRWNKTLFCNKHSKILCRIQTAYNPEPATLSRILTTNVSAVNQHPITRTVS